MTIPTETQLYGRPFSTVGTRALVSALLVAALIGLIAFLLTGCAATAVGPTSTEGADVRTLHAESPIEWQSRARACQDAGKRARAAAERHCDVTSVSVPREACSCQPSAVTAGAWRCSTTAHFTCEGSSLVAGGPR